MFSEKKAQAFGLSQFLLNLTFTGGYAALPIPH